MLVDAGPSGRWVTAAITDTELVAPHLAVFEAANVLRRHELAELISSDQAVQAHADLLDLPIELWPYDLLASRAWELRHNLSIYDASYVALAELTGTTLVTLDARIARAAGIHCTVETPEGPAPSTGAEPSTANQPEHAGERKRAERVAPRGGARPPERQRGAGGRGPAR
ncbi:MAG: type II toxin-antitoxin system VapC family toxin [Actinomycetota bacterium]|nr:type II toxin-antitoxin system VapC family toxin [Actinomycetota bacterium]